jgi:Fur family transcriptional regulator, ferric uptake regulator
MAETAFDEALALFDEHLKRKGLRMTDQRRTMVRAALDQRGHFTAEDLHNRLVGEGEPVSLATVYRALSLLEEAAIVEGHDFADGQRRYEGMLRREHHDHMVCRDCGAVIEFRNPQIEELQEDVVREHGFRIQGHVHNLYVTCEALRLTRTCERRDRVRQDRVRQGKSDV